MDDTSYSLLLAPIWVEHRAKPYAFWLPLIGGSPVIRETLAADGTPCCVEISAYWDDRAHGNIRVILSIDDGSRDALAPHSNDFIISPDGTFVGE